eukprot:349585-Chlamydomonas_euryale.AAC.1
MLMDAAVGADGIGFDEFCELVREDSADFGSVHGGSNLELFDARYVGSPATSSFLFSDAMATSPSLSAAAVERHSTLEPVEEEGAAAAAPKP